MTLNEQLINKISSKIILERLGISNNVLVLTKLIKNRLDNGEYDFTITGLDVNDKLNDFKINKLRIKFIKLRDEKLGFINTNKFNNTKKGVIGEIVFHDNSYSVISHEIQHILQLSKTKISNKDRILDTTINHLYIKDDDFIGDFLNLLYFLSKQEVDAYTYTVLFDVCSELPISFTKNDFNNSIKNHPIWLISEKGVSLKYDDFLNNLDHEDLREIYRNFIYRDRLSKNDNTFTKRIVNTFKVLFLMNKSDINDKSYQKFFKTWVGWINKEAFRLQRKLSNLFDIISETQKQFDIYNGTETISRIVKKNIKGEKLTKDEEIIRDEILSKITNK